MKIKKILSAFITAAITLSMLTACSSGNSDSAVSYDTGDNSSAAAENSDPTGNAPAETSAAAQAESNSSGRTSGEAECTVDGTAPESSAAAYTVSSGYNFFYLYAVNEDIIYSFFACIPEEQCYSGASYTYNDFNSSIGVGMLVYSLDSSGQLATLSYNSADNPDVVTNGSIDVTSFSSGTDAEFSISISYTADGASHTLTGTGYSEYTAIETESQNSSSNSVASNQTCTYCYGTGKCQTCSGMGYTNWGGTTVTCTTCNGSGSCYYCEGTGIQVYLTKGVRIN